MTLKDSCVYLELKWRTRPLVTLACAGGSDEHWQFFHPSDLSMPCFVLVDGTLEEHPDAPDLETER